MRTLSLSGYALCAAAALLAACGGSQPPIGAPGTLPQSSAVTHAERGSWMLPNSSGQDLLYISSGRGNIYVYSYPRAKPVSAFQTPTGGALGECVDSAGDIFVATLTSSGSSTIYEYAHGGTTPIAALSDPGWANGCAVDPDTGNLAVTNPRDPSNPYYSFAGDVAIYAEAQGQPTMYYPRPQIGGFDFCTYDSQGNLYLSAEGENHGLEGLMRLAYGSALFEPININVNLGGHSSVIWDGKHIVVSSYSGLHKPLSLYRFRISGSTGTVVHTTELDSSKDHYASQFWIQGRTVIGTDFIGRAYQDVSFWPYPAGGNPSRNIKKVGHRGAQLYGVAVSVAPSR
jgi:DNA-binding beta-propeller fold protein YncE